MKAILALLQDFSLDLNHFLALEMGLGKTRIVVIALQFLYSIFPELPPCLIVTTHAGRQTWMKELSDLTNLNWFNYWRGLL